MGTSCRVGTCMPSPPGTAFFLCCLGGSLSRGGAGVPLPSHEGEHADRKERRKIYQIKYMFEFEKKTWWWMWNGTFSWFPAGQQLWSAYFCTGQTWDTLGRSPGNGHEQKLLVHGKEKKNFHTSPKVTQSILCVQSDVQKQEETKDLKTKREEKFKHFFQIVFL